MSLCPEWLYTNGRMTPVSIARVKIPYPGLLRAPAARVIMLNKSIFINKLKKLSDPATQPILPLKSKSN